MRAIICMTIFLVGCASPAATPGPPDLAITDKAQRCAADFTGSLPPGFGRLDGTVLAVVPPAHPSCARPNDDHLVLQVLAGGAVYRMVVNIDVLYVETIAPLVGPAFAEGWHTGVALDYQVNMWKKAAFAPADITERVSARLALDARVSVFATTSGGESAHLIHRNFTNQDGAIVVGPSTAEPLYLLFAFAHQVF